MMDTVLDPVAIEAGLRLYNQQVQACRASGLWPDDAGLSVMTEQGYSFVGQAMELPNAPEHLRLRALAIGAAVDNTDDLASLDLGELAAHSEGYAGELVRQVLACVAAPASPAQGEPHACWLQAYQASRAELDALPDDEATGDEPLLGRVNRLEAMILREPAHSKDAVLAKLFVAARVSADGGEPDTGQMIALVAEAEAAFGFGAQAVAS